MLPSPSMSMLALLATLAMLALLANLVNICSAFSSMLCPGMIAFLVSSEIGDMTESTILPSCLILRTAQHVDDNIEFPICSILSFQLGSVALPACHSTNCSNVHRCPHCGCAVNAA